MQETSILSTKLYRPRLLRSLVYRLRLLDHLKQRLHRRLTLVCAPAGYGKTTLVAHRGNSAKNPVTIAPVQ